jgi:Skp family chaperone for outer membrane proteins
LTNDAVAQGVQTSRGQDRIAVIDVKQILEQHVRFKQSMEALKARFKTVSDQLNAERQQIIKMGEKLAQFQPNSAEYNATEEQMQRAKAEWALRAERQKKEFRNSESYILWNVYKEISLETQRYAQVNGIGIVIQFNGQAVDPNKPTEIFQGITRPIVYNAPHLNITGPVLAQLNRGQATARVPVGPGTGPVRTQPQTRPRGNIGVPAPRTQFRP